MQAFPGCIDFLGEVTLRTATFQPFLLFAFAVASLGGTSGRW